MDVFFCLSCFCEWSIFIMRKASTNWNKGSDGGIDRAKILNVHNKTLINAMTASNGCILHVVIVIPTNTAYTGYASSTNSYCLRN